MFFRRLHSHICPGNGMLSDFYFLFLLFFLIFSHPLDPRHVSHILCLLAASEHSMRLRQMKIGWWLFGMFMLIAFYVFIAKMWPANVFERHYAN